MHCCSEPISPTPQTAFSCTAEATGSFFFWRRAKGLPKLSALHQVQQPQVNCIMLTATDLVVNTFKKWKTRRVQGESAGDSEEKALLWLFQLAAHIYIAHIQ